MNLKRYRFVLAAAAFGSVIACESDTAFATEASFSGMLTGAKERPTAVTTTATGQMSIAINSNGAFTYSLTWSDLSGVATGAHIHGPADTGATAAILIDLSNVGALGTSAFSGAASGSASGSLTILPGTAVSTGVSGDSLIKLLHAGKLYVNVHTVANGAGEIRAQLKKQ